MLNLKNKKILMFAPKFFNYENIIKDEIERNGAVVHLYDERNNPTSVEKILIRKIPFLMRKKTNLFYKSIGQKERSFNPDIVFFVSPETITIESIKYLKETFHSSRFILYMYDSIENKNSRYIYQYFDKCLSFDSEDCKKYGFQFRPLFFNNSYKKQVCDDFSYDLGFIGTIHSDRAKILNRIAKQCISQNIRFYYYLFVPGTFMFFLRKVLDKNVRQLKKYIHVVPLDKKEAAKILSSTNYIIDINHPKQVGLTMRTIEMLGMERKIITTNTYIQEYDFYNPKNQILVDRNNVKISKNQFSKDYNTVDSDIYRKYTLEYWTEIIFE